MTPGWPAGPCWGVSAAALSIRPLLTSAAALLTPFNPEPTGCDRKDENVPSPYHKRVPGPLLPLGPDFS